LGTRGQANFFRRRPETMKTLPPGDGAPGRQEFFTNASFFSSSLPRFFASIFSPLCLRAFVAIFMVDENVLWSEGFGYADIENQLKASPDTSYYLASLTKTFASTVILQLVEQGKLDLDAPISTFGIRIHSPDSPLFDLKKEKIV
jgi:CubicO group peptidase (beta-lactamase class C family)